MPDQDCCTNVRSIWPKANSKRHCVNWRRKKNRGRNKEVKETILILFKKALEIHLVESEPRLCCSILTRADTCHSPLLAQLFCSDFCPTSLSSLCPRLWTPLKAGPGQAEWGALATLSDCSAELFQELHMPSTQCNSSMALSDLPDAPRRRAEALNEIRSSMAYSLHSLLGEGSGGGSKTLLRGD